MRAVVVGGVFVALAAGVAVGIVVGGGDDGDDRPRVDPEVAATVPLPPPDPNRVPTGSDPLAGPAALVRTFRELSAPLLELRADTPAGERERVCTDVADVLGAEVDPTALLEAALAIPDPTLSELAVSDRRARADLIVACVAGDRDGTDDAIAQSLAIDVLFERRTEELA